MKNSIVTFFLLLCMGAVPALAQTEELPGSVSKFSIVGLGYQYEKRIGDLDKCRTVVFTAGLNGGASLSSNSSIGYSVGPNITLEFRGYINMDGRVEKGKSIDDYSGWYFALPISAYAYIGEFASVGVSAGPALGYQYAFGQYRRGYLSASGGIGVAVTEQGVRGVSPGTVSMGIILKTKPLKPAE